MNEAEHNSELHDEKPFLDESIAYTLPHFTFNRFENVIAFTLHVKNVEPDSIIVKNSETSYQCKFSTLGSGYVPTYYAFYFEISADSNARMSIAPQTEAWENNVVVQMTIDAVDAFRSYRCGLREDDCNDYVCGDKKFSSARKPAESEPAATNQLEIETAISKKELLIEIKNKQFAAKPNVNDDGLKQQSIKAAKPAKKAKKNDKQKVRSYSESHCDVIDSDTQSALVPFASTDNRTNKSTTAAMPVIAKQRTQSESSNEDHIDSFPLKSILKHHSSYDRTTSENSLADDRCSVSTDLGIGSFKSIPEEKDLGLSDSVKKTVRFDKHLCRKLLFR